MATKNKITLTLDFLVEKQSLQSIKNLIEKDLGKGFTGAKTNDYFTSLRNVIVPLEKDANRLMQQLSKPIGSKKEAQALGKALEDSFEKADDRLLSLQGNIARTFKSENNNNLLKQLVSINSELENLQSTYQRIANLNSKSKGLGNKAGLDKQIRDSQKELEQIERDLANKPGQGSYRRAELTVAISQARKLLKEKEAISAEINKLQTGVGVSSQAELSNLISQKSAQKAGIIDEAMSPQDMATLTDLVKELRREMNALRSSSDVSVGAIGRNYDQAEDEIRKAEEAQRGFNDALRQLGIPMLTLAEMVGVLKQVASYSFDYIKNLDNALTEISVVANKSRNEVLALTDSFIDLSAKTGMAVDDIAQASTIFYQQGLGDEAVEKLTESTAIFAKISGEDVPTAADQITAAMNGFQYSAEQATDIIDKMSVLAAYSAADIDELATAMSKGASQAAMAGLTFDEYNAYLATMIETTREAPENLGTSLKTIMSRFQNIKSGDNTEDDTDVNDVETALKSVGVQLRDSEGQLRELGDVLNELGPKWAGLDRNTQAYLGTVIAGTRQQSRFISLMSHWDRALELTAASEDSAGAAARMHNAAMEGLDATINQFINSWQELISTIANGDTFKGLIKAVTGLIDFFTNGNTGLKLFGAGLALLNLKTIAYNVQAVKQNGEIKNLNTSFQTLKNILTGNIKALDAYGAKVNVINSVTAAVRQQTQAYRELNAAQNGVAAPGIAEVPKGTPVGNNQNKNSKSPKVNVVGTIPLNTKLQQSNLSGEITKTSSALGGFKQTIKSVGTTAMSGLKGIGSMMGTIQVGITAGFAAVSVIAAIEDALTDTAQELKDKALEEFNETQKTIDKITVLQDTVKANADLYDNLSNKMNKSADEVNKLAEAANALAEASPSSVIGYDKDGNAIIDTNKAREEAASKEEELVEAAKEQIGNIGELGRAELREQAEKNYEASQTGKNNKIAQTGGATAMGVGTTLLSAGLFTSWNPAGWVMGLAGLLTIGGALLLGGSKIAKEVEISAEQQRLAREKMEEVWSDENTANIKKNMSIIANASIKDYTTNGVTSNQKSEMASFLGDTWLAAEQQRIYNESFKNGKFDADKFEEETEKIGTKWQQIIGRIGDTGLATGYKKIEELQKEAGTSTYQSMEDAVSDFVSSKLKISKEDPLFESIRDGFLGAAYEGLEYGADAALKDLQNMRNNELAGTESEKKQKEINTRYDNVEQTVKNMTGDEISFYKTSGLLDNTQLFQKVVGDYQDTIKKALATSTSQAAIESILILREYQDELERKADGMKDGKAKDKIKKQIQEYEDNINALWASMESPSNIPWKTLWEDFDKITERAKTAYDTVNALMSGEGIDLSQWQSFTTIFDDIDFSAFDSSQLQDYTNALNTLAGGLTVVNGKLYANADATKTIADLEGMAAEAQLQKTRNELESAKATLEVKNDVIAAEIATIDAKIATIQPNQDAEAAKVKATDAWANASANAMNYLDDVNAQLTENMAANWDNALVHMLDNFGKMINEVKNGNFDASKLSKDFTAQRKEFEKSLSYDSFMKEIGDMDLEQLQALRNSLKQAYDQNSAQIGNINLKLAGLKLGLNTTLDGTGSSADRASEKLETYIGKLREVYNIMNRIERMEHRLTVLDSYFEVSNGAAKAQYWQERLRYTTQLKDQYEALVTMEKQYVNGFRDYIETTSVADVFSFDEFGQIIIDFEKYNKLSNVAIGDGKSQLEIADELYDKYKELYDELLSDNEEYVAYLQKTIDLYKQITDAYIDMEDKAAAAIKEIYQKILDEKLEAIDKEKEAIEDLREAREQARKEQENAEAISDLQTNLQRAMMDTSGASDVSLIKAQKDLDDKLNDIAEDKYSEMLDNIIEQLDEEQEALQDNFDHLFENQEWLFEWLDEEVMRDEERLTELLQQTDEWNTSSALQREQLMQEWTNQYALYMSELSKGSSIMDVWNQIIALQNTTKEYDNAIRNEVSKQGRDVQTAIQNMANQVSNSVSSGLANAYTAGRSSAINYNKPNNTISPSDDSSPKPKPGSNAPVSQNHGGIVKPGFGAQVYNSSGFPIFNKKEKAGTNVKFAVGATYRKAIQINGTLRPMDVYKRKDGNYMLASDFSRIYKHGGLVDFTGPAWLDGTRSKPEAVLNSLQTEHFIKFTNALDKMMNSNISNTNAETINIESISFNVDSMSSAEDGEKAFNMFVNKFKEIGNRTGIKVNSFKNTL